jgi:hypothetical protein
MSAIHRAAAYGRVALLSLFLSRSNDPVVSANLSNGHSSPISLDNVRDGQYPWIQPERLTPSVKRSDAPKMDYRPW